MNVNSFLSLIAESGCVIYPVLLQWPDAFELFDNTPVHPPIMSKKCLIRLTMEKKTFLPESKQFGINGGDLNSICRRSDGHRTFSKIVFTLAKFEVLLQNQFLSVVAFKIN